MKASLKKCFVLPTLIGSLVLMLAVRITAQNLTTVYSFAPISTNPGTNSDGANPQAGLILSGNTLYGTAYEGGCCSNGTVFRVNMDGTGFTNLHNFGGTDNSGRTNQDGANPQAGLVLVGNTLFGTAIRGGYWGNGTVFAVSTDGTTFTTLHSFSASVSGTNNDGAYPQAPLVLSGNCLYGTTSASGSSAMGTVFAINTDGAGFTNLHNFSPAFGRILYTNSEGANPQARLLLAGSSLYGAATRGGFYGFGSLFKLNTDGTGFTNLHNFSARNGNTNADGTLPMASLALSGDTLYGTAESGGSSGAGTVFAIKADGTAFTNLHSFVTIADNYNDGGYPVAGLTLSGDTLYGTTASGAGTVFAIKTDGIDFTNLYSFSANGDGFDSYSGLVLSGNALYGTTTEGGRWSAGTVFSLTLPPVSTPLTITPSGVNVILSWPTNSSLFTLQSTTDLGSSPVWTTVCSTQMIVNGQNTVTNPVTGSQQFFRLSQ